MIDFSLPKGVDNLLEALLECPKILVSGTTGLEKETLEKMQQLALKAPLFACAQHVYRDYDAQPISLFNFFEIKRCGY